MFQKLLTGCRRGQILEIFSISVIFIQLVPLLELGCFFDVGAGDTTVSDKIVKVFLVGEVRHSLVSCAYKIVICICNILLGCLTYCPLLKMTTGNPSAAGGE